MKMQESTMKYADAHNILRNIGYNLNRQKGSHRVYTKPNSDMIVLAPHGKDLSAAQTKNIQKIIMVHKVRNLAEKILNNNLSEANILIEEIILLKLQEQLEKKKRKYFYETRLTSLK